MPRSGYILAPPWVVAQPSNVYPQRVNEFDVSAVAVDAVWLSWSPCRRSRRRRLPCPLERSSGGTVVRTKGFNVRTHPRASEPTCLTSRPNERSEVTPIWRCHLVPGFELDAPVYRATTVTAPDSPETPEVPTAFVAVALTV